MKNKTKHNIKKQVAMTSKYGDTRGVQTQTVLQPLLMASTGELYKFLLFLHSGRKSPACPPSAVPFSRGPALLHRATGARCLPLLSALKPWQRASPCKQPLSSLHILETASGKDLKQAVQNSTCVVQENNSIGKIVEWLKMWKKERESKKTREIAHKEKKESVRGDWRDREEDWVQERGV